MPSIIKAFTRDGGRPAAFAFGTLEREFAPQMDASAQPAANDHAERPDDLACQLVAARGAVDAICAAREQWLAHWQRAVLSLATAIAERVIRREVERTPEVALALVKESLELAAGSADVRLVMHPDDLAALSGQVERLTAELARLGDATIVTDDSLCRGGCRVETRFGTIDQQIETQLARIALELA
jgi:flagellar assembly protein FliH